MATLMEETKQVVLKEMGFEYRFMSGQLTLFCHFDRSRIHRKSRKSKHPICQLQHEQNNVDSGLEERNHAGSY